MEANWKGAQAINEGPRPADRRKRHGQTNTTETTPLFRVHAIGASSANSPFSVFIGGKQTKRRSPPDRGQTGMFELIKFLPLGLKERVTLGPRGAHLRPDVIPLRPRTVSTEGEDLDWEREGESLHRETPQPGGWQAMRGGKDILFGTQRAGPRGGFNNLRGGS